jgi:hypothetical protein
VTGHFGAVGPLSNERRDVKSTSQKKSDGGTPGPARAFSGRAALRREHREQLGSNHHETEPQGRKARLNTGVTSAALGKEELVVRL